MKPIFCAITLAFVALTGCDDSPQAAASAGPPTPALTVTEWALPTAAGAAQPDLVATDDGLLLSWIEPLQSGHALRFARYRGGAWGAPRQIARGEDWFVNWADTPHLASTADGALWAHWLQKSAAATYAYDVALTRSEDGGANWSAPVLVNDDGTPTEHGFVSLWPMSDSSLGVAWLDGRETGSGGHDAHATSSGAMTLRAASFDAALQRSGEARIDAMTCDCCQTDVALTARGPLLVYRDRTPAEIRDIAVSRLQGGRWSVGRSVHADEWTMPACPVNGPAVAARGDEAVVAWYTAAGGTPTLKLARSSDAGDTFGAPVTFDRGEQVQGRVDVALDQHAAWVLWLREDAQGQSLQLARHAADLSRELQRVEIARLQGRGRGTGFAQLVLAGDTAHVVWTDVVDGRPRLRGAQISADDPAPRL
ncbi:sialidase family protein [Lysobacter sp. D1-1-M9]|uniref:sialidase family protein n=1 Tax=Novilysobacter longmucuonensis TaxID=3098603 RepID=UPI002FC96E3A